MGQLLLSLFQGALVSCVSELHVQYCVYVCVLGGLIRVCTSVEWYRPNWEILCRGVQRVPSFEKPFADAVVL